MLDYVSTKIYGSEAKKSADEENSLIINSLKQDNVEKDFLRCCDIVGAVFGLALGGVCDPTQSPKITARGWWLYSKTIGEDAEERCPTIINANSVPTKIQGLFQSFNRLLNGDSRDLLEFYNLAIPLVNQLYPTNSMESDQNDTMYELWGLVLDGIKVLKRSYYSQLLDLFAEEADIEKKIQNYRGDEMESVHSFYLEQKKNEIQLALERQENLENTFTAWETEIKGYRKMERKEPKFINLLLREDNSNEKIKEEPTVAYILAKIEGDLKTFNVENKLKFEAEDYKILQDLRRIIDSTINNGSVPKKMDPFSNKLKKLWTLEKIKNFVANINSIKLQTDEHNRIGELKELRRALQEQAVKYMLLVEHEQKEVIKY